MWAAIAQVGMQVGGSVLRGFSAYGESKEREAVATYNAQVARDQGMAQKRAIDVQNKIEQDVWRGDISKTEAVGGVRGVVMDEGSPLLAETEAYSDMIADASEMQRQGEIARIAGVNKAKTFEREAEYAKKTRWMTTISAGLGGG